ncbi:Protein R12A1.3 [Aphelenchoides avenae]|nr:Protein R12A1.3 [Aphelenchus avenae]
MRIRRILLVGTYVSIFLVAYGQDEKEEAAGSKIKPDICEYYRQIGKLDEHPECLRETEVETTTTRKPPPPPCSSHTSLVQCTADQNECPKSGQICTQSDGSKCCQATVAGIPVSHINSKAGSCPEPLGITTVQDAHTGCWLDTSCPGIQKCCLEPNPVARTATRICRDPVGITSWFLCGSFGRLLRQDI